MKKHLAVAIALCALAGCDIDLAALLGLGRGESQVAKLQRFTSEEELRSYLLDQEAASFTRGGIFTAIDVALEAGGGNVGFGGAAPTADGAPDGSSTDTVDQNYSTTTEQEEGVHEADVIKNDGEYVYVLTRGALRIVRATPPDAMAEVGTVELGGYGSDMYVAGDRVVTVTTPDTPVFLGTDGAAQTVVAPDFPYYSPQTVITVIDVTQRSTPNVLSHTRLDGRVDTSRMIDNRLYVVAVNDPVIYVDALPGRLEKTSLEEVSLDDILPNISIEVAGEEVFRGNVAEFSDHFRPVDADGLGLTSIITLDIDSPQDYQAQTVVAYPANVYASTQALYLTDNDYNPEGKLRETTDIYKFAFTAEGTAPVASGSIPGRVLNQYSISEHDGFLRLATTVGPSFGPFDAFTESSNNVYVLEQNGDLLEIAGAVEGLAPGETIFSARFVGDKGYLVTFEQIDPLFTVDLADPRDPRAMGELEVPGFSTFIMPMGDNHLLTIGRHLDPESGQWWPDAVRLSVFDVSDFSQPRLAHFEIIGTNGASSEAIYNPKALTYFAEQNLLAFPVEIFGFGGGFPDVIPVFFDQDQTDTGTNGGTVPGDEPVEVTIELPPVPEDFFVGLYVYRVTADGGFDRLGRISTASSIDPYVFFGPQFTRGAFIGDTVYAVTSEGVQSAAVADVETILSSVEFPAPDVEFPVPLPEPGMPVGVGVSIDGRAAP